MQRVIDAILALLNLDLAAAADADHHNAAGELRQPLLQLLTVVVGGGLLDLRPDLVAAALNSGSLDVFARSVAMQGVAIALSRFLSAALNNTHTVCAMLTKSHGHPHVLNR